MLRLPSAQRVLSCRYDTHRRARPSGSVDKRIHTRSGRLFRGASISRLSSGRAAASGATTEAPASAGPEPEATSSSVQAPLRPPVRKPIQPVLPSRPPQFQPRPQRQDPQGQSENSPDAPSRPERQAAGQLTGPPQRKAVSPRPPQRPVPASNGTGQPHLEQQTDLASAAEQQISSSASTHIDQEDRRSAPAPAESNGAGPHDQAANNHASLSATDSPHPAPDAAQNAAQPLRQPPRRPVMQQLPARPKERQSAAPRPPVRQVASQPEQQREATSLNGTPEAPESRLQLEEEADAMIQQAEYAQDTEPEREAVRLTGPPKRTQAAAAALAAPAAQPDSARRPDMRRPVPKSDAEPARPAKTDKASRGRARGQAGYVEEEPQPSNSRRGKIDEMRLSEREGERPTPQRRRKPNAGARRAAREERKERRSDIRSKNANEQEEVFEIGLQGMSVAELSHRLAIPAHELLAKLFEKGIAAQVNQILDRETVKSLAEEYDVLTLDQEEDEVDKRARKAARSEDQEEGLLPRPPVVTVMGHVDHGKTSLLDYIRKAKVAAGEAGGITQAIGAYTCALPPTEDGDGPGQITFLDTPGHEAFSAMRARGTRVTDIAVIVVAADDGVRPQTLEAISHARAAEVPIIVAINKIDKDGANIERVKQGLSEAGLLPEEWGGQTPMVAISAKKGQNVDELLETVLLVAEVEDLTANPDKLAEGTVIEAHMDRQTGAVATLLVSSGTLRAGDAVAAGAAYGKVRLMRDSLGQVSEATPSIAVQMTGLNSLPAAGDDFVVYASEAEARKRASAIVDAMRQDRLAAQAGNTMISTRSTFASLDEDMFDQPVEELKLNLILKTDTSGSIEALKSALAALPQERIGIRYLHAAAGPVTAADVDLAAAAEGSRVIAFNTPVSESVLANAKTAGVEVHSYTIIYELIDEVRAAMEGELGFTEERVPLGEAAVRAVFGSGSRKVAGCMVTEGLLKRDAVAEVMRGSKTVHEGKIISLRRVKDDVKEIGASQECGVGVEDFADWREGDKIVAFELVSKRQSLEAAAA